MRAELIFTGTELLSGQVANSHASFLGSKLSALGIKVIQHTTVGDHRQRIKAALGQALACSDLVIITGGLGSTTDDLTKEVLAELLKLELLLDEGAYLQIKERYPGPGSGQVPRHISRQAYLPVGARALHNRLGTAPGVLLETGGCVIIMLPGPPAELKCMFEESVAVYLAGLDLKGTVTRFRMVRVTGIAEEVVQGRLQDLGGQGNPWLAYTAKPGEVQIRVYGSGTNGEEAIKLLNPLYSLVKEQLAEFIFGYDDQHPAEVVGKLLAGSGLTLAVAESCTGGMIAEQITRVPGSSDYFLGGVVAYDNTVKSKVLGVADGTLAAWGAVSGATAGEMARGVGRALGADIGLAVTGIAGPGGGTLQKPVGLVYIALAGCSGTVSQDYIFPGGRQGIRKGTVNAALHMLSIYLEKLKRQRST